MNEFFRRMHNAWDLTMARGLWWGYAALRIPADEFERQGVARLFPSREEMFPESSEAPPEESPKDEGSVSDFDWKPVSAPNGLPGFVARFAGVRAIVIGDRWAVGRTSADRSGISGTQAQAKTDARSAAFGIAVRGSVSQKDSETFELTWAEFQKDVLRRETSPLPQKDGEA